MSELKAASENIKRLAVMFKGLVELSNEIDKLESLDGHVKELELSRNQLMQGNEDLIKQNSRMMELIESHKMDIESMMIKAKAECEEMKAEAVVKGDELYEKAKLAFEKSQELIKEQEASFEIKKANHEEMIKALESAIEEKSKKLEEINAALDKIKGGI